MKLCLQYLPSCQVAIQLTPVLDDNKENFKPRFIFIPN